MTALRNAISGTLNRLSDHLYQWQDRSFARELDRLGEHALRHMLNALDLTRDDLPSLLAEGAKARLLPDMAGRYGLDLDQQETTIVNELQRHCIRCPVKLLCIQTLRAEASREDCQRLCHNSTLLASLAQHGSAQIDAAGIAKTD